MKILAEINILLNFPCKKIFYPLNSVIFRVFQGFVEAESSMDIYTTALALLPIRERFVSLVLKMQFLTDNLTCVRTFRLS